MDAAQKQHLIKLYGDTLARHGDTPQAVHWTAASQKYRFKLLCDIADLETASVLDYGCGKGDLYPFLAEQGFRGQYTGFDINSQLIGLARQKFPGVRFEILDIEQDAVSEQFDYALISGLFNNRVQDNWGMMTAVLRKAYAVVRHGLAFNAISTYVTRHDAEMYYASPEEVFRFCVTELSRHVTLRHHEPPYNYTVYVYRKPEWKP